MTKNMYEQQRNALNLIGKGYEEIREANKKKREAEKVEEIQFAGGSIGENGKPETMDISKMTVEQKDELITTLSGAVMELTGRLDNLEKGGGEQ
ncbi:hypothetical protein [Saccharococcus sp. Marseille-Q5394]|uniref:hypothetical protein n=1 Tax=Saccharococcus sp. Marseille-Q5394 TaxID=2972778 RepID=UPI0021C62420|nr:hypothetical protein [Saccharococcus sp. Marseille-Q5394]